MQISRELVGQQLTSEMGLCTLHNCCFSCLLDYLKSILKSNSHRPLTVLGFRVKETALVIHQFSDLIKLIFLSFLLRRCSMCELVLLLTL